MLIIQFSGYCIIFYLIYYAALAAWSRGQVRPSSGRYSNYYHRARAYLRLLYR